MKFNFFRKFGWKKQNVSLAHLEYLKRKGQLERDDTQRWEYPDWDRAQEIRAFSNRLGIDLENFSVFDQSQIEPAEAFVLLEESVRKFLPDFVCVSFSAENQIISHLTSDENVAKIAKNYAFPDLLHLKDPSDEIIAAKFVDLLISVENKDDIVKKIFLPEILATHNILTIWPEAWEDPIKCLENTLGSE